MFTNKGSHRPADTNLPALPEPTQRRTSTSRSGIASIIANGVKITGTIDADGAELQVDGEIEGNVRGGSLTVGDTGMVKGDVVSESVTVHGRVEGSVRARKVMLARNAHVLGDIVHQSLSVEMGAVFEGQCRYLLAGAAANRCATRALGLRRRQFGIRRTLERRPHGFGRHRHGRFQLI
jgi:cytoskeletal protein CcmA (bactofilin family)